MRHRYRVEAARELLHATEYYQNAAEDLGADFIDEVDRATAAIESAPRRWPKIDKEVRKYRLHRFPYGIFYRILDSDFIEILAIIDLRRNENTWRNRP